MRCVNDRAKYGRSEIVDAQLNCMVATIEEFGDDDSVFDGNTGDILQALDSIEDENYAFNYDGEGLRRNIKKRSFKGLACQPDRHPFFSKGVWYFRHVSSVWFQFVSYAIVFLTASIYICAEIFTRY